MVVREQAGFNSIMNSIEGSEFRVGNLTDPTGNPQCDHEFVGDGGFFKCDLWGDTFTIFKPTTGGVVDWLWVGEVSVWSDKNICPKGKADQQTVDGAKDAS